MGARITRKVDFKVKTNALIAKLNEGMGVAVADAAFDIVQRTTKGVDVNDKSFKDYSPQYKKYRAEKLKRPTGVVNLQVTGQMLAAIRQTISKKESKVVGIIDFGDETNRKKAQGNSRYRDFFGLSDKQVKKIIETVNEYLKGI